MTSSNASAGSKATGFTTKRRHLSAEKKFQIYLETQHNDQPIGEILRREGLFSTDLARIRQQVKEGAIQRLNTKPGRKPKLVSSLMRPASDGSGQAMSAPSPMAKGLVACRL